MDKICRRDFLRLAGIGIPLASSGLAFNSRSWKTEQPVLREHSEPWLEINLDNIEWNLRQLKTTVNERPIMAVIKNNAYGHGQTEVAEFLQERGIEYLAVAKAHDALDLRTNGISCPILNFGMFSSEEAEELVGRRITQSVFTDEFVALDLAARRLSTSAKVHIKVDTGLGRVGVPYQAALPFIRRVAASANIEIEGIFTTLTEDEEFDKVQLARFLEVCDASESEGIEVGIRHAASSAGILSFPQAHLDLVRPGITIYGHYPSEKTRIERKIDLKPVLELKAPVQYIKTLQPGEGVSYHRPFIAWRETVIATIGLGYFDGYPPDVANNCDVLINGRRHPILVPLTSNHLAADLLGHSDVNIGDEVVLIGKQGDQEVSAEEVAKRADISVYQLLIGMNPLLPKRYINARA